MTIPNASWNPADEYRLKALAPDLWISRHPLSLFGFRMVTCMTVVRLANGELWLHSPVPLDKERKTALDALGPVGYIVAPNRMHHLYAADALRQYPAARLYGAPGLAAKNPLFANAPEISAGPAAPWAASLDSVFVEGNPELNESVFFHPASRTLVITDLAVHLGPWDSFATRCYARLNGCYGRFGHSFVLRKLFRDQDAARQSIRRILAWDFQRIVLAHGPVIDRNARQALESAFAWLL